MHKSDEPDGATLTVYRRKCFGRKALTVSILATLLCAFVMPAAANKLSERNRQKQAAEAERTGLQRKLADLKRDIGLTEAAKSQAEEALAKSETAISQINRSLFELQQEQSQAQAKLTQLSEEQARLTRTIVLQQAQLGRLLRNQYVNGAEDRTKLLLSGDNPNRINRDLQYFGYVSKAQTALLTSLRENLKQVEENKHQAEEAKQELDDIEHETREQKTLLEKEKTQRASLLAQLSGKLASQRKQAGTIEKNDQRLASLVDKLSRLIEEQRRADAEKEQRRREQQAQARRESRSADRGTKITRDDDTAPAKSLGRNELTPEANVQDQAFPRSFAALRGQLRLPVKGDLIAKFGSRRGDAPPSKGLFIRAEEGAEIKSVAGGRVAFADWLRGFGNLIIVDHGNQYMTIYGNNQAVLKHAGDVVKVGDVIATAGNSGGNEQSGLYFEMRFQGRAFDPLQWVTLK
jgi:septal ring factor EnvC (AmiA/AmiB activator)